MTRKPSVPERVRRQVQERAQGRCEYYLIHEADMYYPHEADHVIAEKHGGPASLENLAWACFYCNRFKGSDLASVDPTSQKVVFLCLSMLKQGERVEEEAFALDSRMFPEYACLYRKEISVQYFIGGFPCLNLRAVIN